MEIIYTPRLILRKAKMNDLESVYKNIWSDERLTSKMLWKINENIDEAKERLEKTIEYQSSHYAYFVCPKDSDEVIGFAGIIEVEDGVYEDTGICIANDYQGQGFGKEVVNALKELIFNKLKGKRFLYSAFSDNYHSKKLCESLGFKYLKSENKIREHDKHEYISDVYYLDNVD